MPALPYDRLNEVVSAIIPDYIVSYLNIVWFVNPYIYINTWSILHLLWGAAMPFVIGEHKYISALIIHTVWEIIEYILAYGGHPLFVEEFIDILWDTIIYMIGYMLVSYIMDSIYKKENRKQLRYTV
jgi:hypothetical protein